MYFKNNQCVPYYDPTEDIIYRDSLVEIDITEFNSLVVEINKINQQPINLQVLAKKTRDSEVSSDLVIPSLDNASFQCTSEAKDIKGVITEAISVGAVDEDIILFRLSDNSWKEVSFTQLKEVLVSFTLRKKLIWTQFAEWDLGDKLVEFSVNYGDVLATLEEPIVDVVIEEDLVDTAVNEDVVLVEEVAVEETVAGDEEVITPEEIIIQSPEEVIVGVVG